MEFRIPTQDLIKEMFKSGYKKKAKELGKEYLNREELKGVLSKSVGENILSKELIQVLQCIANTQEKIICKIDEKRLIIYPFENERLLVEMIENNQHIFSTSESLLEILGEFYSINTHMEKSGKARSLKIDSTFYEYMHTMDEEELEGFIEKEAGEFIGEEGKSEALKDLLKDFKSNKQRTNSIIFTYGKRVESLELFFPGEDCIWLVEYGKKKNDEVTISSIPSKPYFQVIEETIRKYFNEFPTSKENREKSSFFSYKRGATFFWRSNLLLLGFCLLLLMTISDWPGDGNVLFVALIVQGDALILILSLLSSFRGESIKLKDVEMTRK